MKLKIKKLYIIISVIILSIIMNLIDIFIKPNYFIRSIIKVILFLIVPLVYYFKDKKEKTEIKKLFIPQKKDLSKSIILGFGIYVSIVGCYLALKEIVDFSPITESLTTNVGVNKNNFIFVSLYISLFNSFLEEFFFRGYSFITLKNQTNRKFAYLFSSLIFSLYHAGMTTGWFNPILYIFMLIGLFIGGLIFNYLNEKCNNIYPSWIVHMFANFGINTVGFILFGLI